MRLFVAIDVSNDIHDAITKYLKRLQPEIPDSGVKWVRPDSWHVTLKFIGESSKVEEIKRALEGVESRGFELSFGGTGFFTPRSPRVFWIGVRQSEELSRLAATVDEALSTLGIPLERNSYHPHITLARFGSGRPEGSPRDRNKPKMYELKRALEAKPELANPDFGTMAAREYILYRSETLPEGSRYTKLTQFPLLV